MHTFQNTVTIARPAGEVSAFLADLRNIPRWNRAIARTVPTSTAAWPPQTTKTQLTGLPPENPAADGCA